MDARDLAQPYPTIGRRQGVLDAASLLTDQHRHGLIVVDEDRHPVAVMPGWQVLRLLIPGYVQDDPTLAAVVDDDYISHVCDSLAGRTVAELLPQDRSRLAVVPPDHSVLEVAALMAAERVQLVAVVEGPGRRGPLLGAVTLPAVLAALLPKRVTDG